MKSKEDVTGKNSHGSTVLVLTLPVPLSSPPGPEIAWQFKPAGVSQIS